MRVVGIVVNVDGKYFAKDKAGNVRTLHVGDKIYEGEQLYGTSNSDSVAIQDPSSSDKIVLFGFEEYIAESFGQTVDTPQTQIQTPSQETPKQHPSTTSSTQTEAVGFQEVFLARDADIVNVEASLLDTGDDRAYLEQVVQDEDAPVSYSDVIVTLSIADITILEDAKAVFIVSVDVAPKTDVTFNFTTLDGSALDGDDYKAISGSGIIKAGTLSTTITVDLLDDYIADNAEQFDVVLSNPSSNAIVSLNDATATATIEDNAAANTPFDASDVIENSLETVFIKVVATDSLGNILTPSDANGAKEGEKVYYKVIIVDDNSNMVLDANGNPASGNVDILYTDVTAVGSSDFDNTLVNVALNSVFSVDIFNDTLKEPHETFELNVVNNSYSNAAEFENVLIDTSKITTTIVDNVDANPESVNVKEGGLVINTPNLLDNDEVGLHAEVTGFRYKDESGTTQSGVIGQVTDTQYGTITINADGSWSYTSDLHEEHPDDLNTESAILPDIVEYTITDSDGESDSSTLSINVEDTIATITPQVALSLDEDDLLQGSDTTKESLVLSDIALGINLNQDPIENVFFDLAKVETALGSLESAGRALTYTLSNSDHTLVATDYHSNTIFEIIINPNSGDYDENSNYTFTLYGTLDHPTAAEDILNIAAPFSVKELGPNEDVIDATLNINIVDDIPTAVSDRASLQEGVVQNRVTGNVFTNDILGADDENSTLPIVSLDGGTLGQKYYGSYGELLLKADGSYTYYLDNTRADVKILIDGETIHDVFTYTMADSDGDRSSATLDITIEGNSKDPVIVVQNANVDEAALTIGTDPSSNAEIATGSIAATANDGLYEVRYEASDGSVVTFSLAELESATFVPKSLVTPQGVLTFTDFRVTNHPLNPAVKIGIMDYSYELTTPYTNALISDNFDDVVSVIVEDANHDIKSESLTISIADDKPLAQDDANTITEDSATLTTVIGSVLTNDNDGADTNLAPIDAQNIAGQYGQFVLATDGSYTYILDNNNPVVDALNSGDTLVDSLVYTLRDADGDAVSANLDITINGFTDPNISVGDVIVLEDGQSGGNLQLVFLISMDKTSLRDVTFDYKTLNVTALDGKEYFHVSGTATIVAGQTTASVVVNLAADDYVADSGKTFELEISNVNSAGLILDNRGLGTIEDDAKVNTPYNSSDTIEESQESVTLKLISVDAQGNEIASSVIEGEKAYYKVIVVDSAGNAVFDKDGHPAQGTVNVLVSDGTAHADNPITHIGDFDGTTPLNVSVNTVFSVQTTDDFVSDSGETFHVAIADDASYSNASDYENVLHDITAVQTTITDGTISVIQTTLELSGDSSVIEGTSALYTLTLRDIPEVDMDVTVSVTHLETDDVDFDFSTNPKTQVVTILAGQTTATFTLDTFDDIVYEADENYKVKIDSTTGGNFESLTITVDSVVTSITDNDTKPELSISDITILEDGTASFTVTLSGETKTPVNFTYNTSDGTATAGDDYTAVVGGSGTIQGTTGNLTTTITIPLLDDNIADDAETFNVTLSTTASNAVVSSTNGSATATINDDSNNTPYKIDSVENNHEAITLKVVATDSSGNILATPQANVVDEGKTAYYKVIAQDALGNEVLDIHSNPISGTLNVVISDDTAVATNSVTGIGDYDGVSPNKTLNVALNTVFSVDTIDDYVSDDAESFNVTLADDTSYSNASEYERVIHNQTSVVTTITDDVDITTLNLSGDRVVDEGASASYTLTLSHAPESDLDVTVSLVNTSTDDTDFDFATNPKIQVVTILAGQTTASFSIDTFDDVVYEGLENYKVEITGTSGGDFEQLNVGTSQVVTSITDNDTKPELSISDITILEDDTALFTVTLSGESKNDVTFNFNTFDGTALEGKDYDGVISGLGTVNAGSLTTTISVNLIDDYLADDGETFNVVLSNPSSNATIVTGTATATIGDNSEPNTPFDSTDAVENNLESVNVKLLAYDHNGIQVSSNEVQEGGKGFYIVILVDGNGDPILDENGNYASGNVDIVYTDGSASGGSGVSAVQGEIDYNNTRINVQVNKFFSVEAFDDAIHEGNETFEVNVVNDTYTLASDFENVVTDTSKITTIIKESDVPTVTFVRIVDNAVVREADGALLTHSIEFVELDGTPVNIPNGESVTVNLEYTVDSTDNSDFQTKETQVVITGDGTTHSFSFSNIVTDDAVYEGVESYRISVDSIVDGTSLEQLSIFPVGQKTKGTIIDIDDIPELSISDITIVEDGSNVVGIKDGQLKAVFTVEISNAKTATQDIHFNFKTADGSAIAGEDYTAIATSATILAGSNFVRVEVPLIDDYFTDDMETFSVSIDVITPLVRVANATATATLNDNTNASTDEFDKDVVTLKLIATDANGDPLADTTKNSVNEGDDAYYKVLMLDENGNPVLNSSGVLASGDVEIAYTNGDATGGDGSHRDVDDYVNSVTTVAINQVFHVSTVDDTLHEANEKFELNIVDASYTLRTEYEEVLHSADRVETTIVDDGTTPVYLHIVNDATVEEADGAALIHTLEFRDAHGNLINLESGKQVTVNLTYTNDTTELADFQSKETQVIITGDGGSSYNFSNLVKDDFLNEISESYTLGIGSVVDTNNYFENLQSSSSNVVGTINDEVVADTALVSITGAQSIKEGESSTAFLISLDQPSSDVTSDIVVHLIYSGVAQDGVDFHGVAQVTIAAGSNSQTFTLPTINDKLVEGSETFTIAIDTIVDSNFEAIAPNPNATSVLNTIVDDVDANPDTNALLEGTNQVTGNLLTNDELGVNAKVTSFTYRDESGNIKIGSVGVEEDTQYGRITVSNNGDYVYISDALENHPSDGDTVSGVLADVVHYRIMDDNGDKNISTLTLNVGDTMGSIVDSPMTSVDEDDLSSGSDTTKESLIVHSDLGIQKGPDDVESVTFDLSEVQSALGSLKSHGVALSYSLSPNATVLTANAGVTEVFTITLNQAGGASSYDFELKSQLDHLNSSGAKLDNLDLVIPFRYKEQGATEDIVRGNLSVRVLDDTPTAVAEVDDKTVVEGSATLLSGNVLTNDIQGADGALLLDFKYQDTTGTTQNVLFSSSVTTHSVDTATGSLTVNQDGSWSFTAHTYVDHDDVKQGDTSVGDGSDNDSTQGSFEYRLQDFDGDNSSYVKQIIHVTDGTDPISSGVVNVVDEDDIAVRGSDKTQSPLVSGTLDVTGGTDPIDTTFTTVGSNTLTSNGVNITYILSNDGHTLTGKAGNVVIFEAKITGSATVNNPTYSFELKGALDHPDALGENTQEIAIEYRALDIDGDRVTSNLVITVTDDIPTIGTPFNLGEVDEAGLPFGSTTDISKTLTGGTLDVHTEADSFDTIFDSDTITALEALNLDAGNPPDFLLYTISNAGHTLTATGAGKDIFVVNITDATTINAAYDFTLINAFNHNGATDKTLPFNFTTKDFDGDSTTAHFDVKVIDDTGVATKDIVVKEDGTVDFGLTADTISSTSDFITAHGLITFDSATNLYTYTPDLDYSGNDTFDITYTTTTTTTTTIHAAVKPVSDTPLTSRDALNISTNEDTLIALGFNAPIVKDDYDQNDVVPNSHDVDGDNPERLGAIILSGIPSGTEVHFGTTIITATGLPITIQISDLDENSDGTNDHVSGLTTAYTMTKAEFEQMHILPPPNSGDNIRARMTVLSYEVDDAGVKLVGVAGKTSYKTVKVDVQAVTDTDFAIASSTRNGDEDNWIRIDDGISITKTSDVDGSESYSLVFSGDKFVTGTQYKVGTGSAQDASSGFTVDIPNIDDFIAGNYPIYVMTPTNDSSDIKQVKVTLNVTDSDSDSSGTITTEHKATYIDIEVTPIANDITVSSSGSVGDEDTRIALNLLFTNSDTNSERVTSVTISDIPTGAKIFDENGNEVIQATPGSVTISIASGITTDIENYTMQPPAHSSKDITLKVSIEIADRGEDAVEITDTATIAAVDVQVEVKAVTETDKTDSANPSGTDVTQNSDHIYTTYGSEDVYFNLNSADAGFNLFATNEDDKSQNPYGSEETFLIFTNIRAVDSAQQETPMDNTTIKYNDGTQDVIQTLSNTQEVKVPIEYLSSVELLAAKDYAGTIKVDTFVQSQDFDEDTNSAATIENSDISTLTININPVIDGNPNVNISQSIGTEDDGRISDGKITTASVANGIDINASISSLDPDGSEKFRVFIDAIPEDAALFYKNNIIYANSGNNFSSDGITVVDNGDGTFKVQLEDYSTTIAPKIIPPHNFDGEITLKVSSQTTDTATMSDGSTAEVVGPISIVKDLHIKVDAVADQVIHTQLKHFNVQEDSTIITGDKFQVVPDVSGAYNLVVQEDSSSSGIGAAIAINELFVAANSINSYDNLKSNTIDTSPVNDTSVASENVTITIKNLGAEFDISGATLVGGTGSSRIWSTTLGDFKAGNILVTTPKDFSGEVDFDMKFIATESTGNTKEGALEHIKVLVTPVAEDMSGIPFEALDMKEDVLESVTIGFSGTLPDKNGNAEKIHELWIKVDDVSGKDFKLFYDDGNSKYNEIDTVLGLPDISKESIAGVDYYHMQNNTFQDLYLQYDSDRGSSLDTQIDVKATFIDYITLGSQTIANVSTRTDNIFSINLTAVTDDIDAKVLADTDVTWSNNTDYDNPTPKDEIQNIILDTNGDLSLDVMSNTQLKIAIDIQGIDTASEVDINNTSDTTNNPDYDGSEKIVRIRLDGVPQGVDVEGGYYAGDTGTPPIYSGIWYVENPQDASGGDLTIDGATTYNLQLNISGDNTLGHEVGGTIVASFENKDGAAAIESDSVIIKLDDSNFVAHNTPLVPIDILEWETDNSFQIVEDTQFTLNDIVNFVVKTDSVGDGGDGTYGGIVGATTGEVISSTKFSITVEGIENATVSGTGWNLDSTHSTPFYTFQGQGGQSEIDAALTALKIQPDKDYNENARPSLYTGPLELRTVLTTYGAGGLMDKQGVDYSGDVQPVTDTFDLNPDFTFINEDGLTVLKATEDGSVAIKINPSSVDNPYLSVVGSHITVENTSLVNSVGETMDGKITYNDGTNIVTVDLKVGESIDIPESEIDTAVFRLYDFRNDASGNERGNYLAGEVRLKYTIDLQEVGATGITPRSGEINFYVNPVADGLDIINAKLVGSEDTYVEMKTQSGDSFDSIGVLVDPTETLQSLVIDGVPNGYLVFYGDTHQHSASVIGVSGGLVSFSVPVGGGNPPKVWILPPANVGGVSSFAIPNFDLLDSITLKVGVDDMGAIVFNTKPVHITINAVADVVTINPADSNGVEGSDIKLNFNTTVVDTDNSENLVVTLQGLHQDAVFKLDGVEIDNGYITYDKASDTYTIKNASIDYTNVSKLTFMQNNFSGTVTTTVVAQEKSNFDIYPTPATATFGINIAQQDGTSTDDVLLFDKTNGNDGLSGSDTLVFGYDWAQESIDFTLYDDALTKNIERLNLIEHGDHNIALSATDLVAMSDSNNELTINANYGDSVALVNDGDNVWAQKGMTNVYEGANGGELTISGLGVNIGDALLNPTAGDDTLGYNDSKSIDAGDGNDRLIIFQNHELDFSKVQNVEEVDLSVVGDHTMSNITIADVVGITDATNHLKIFGDTNDSVDFSANENWTKGAQVTENGKTFDVYTTISDPSVEVKVEDAINDSI